MSELEAVPGSAAMKYIQVCDKVLHRFCDFLFRVCSRKACPMKSWY